jgi:hypothetical protein
MPDTSVDGHSERSRAACRARMLALVAVALPAFGILYYALLHFLLFG